MKIFSIFPSINGEVCKHGIGSMTTFIRLAGCHANCPYCDTEYAKDPDSGMNLSISLIVKDVVALGSTRVTITGGEPLEQKGTARLIEQLTDLGIHVSVETNGLHAFDRREGGFRHADWVVDIKNHVPFSADHYVRMNLRKIDFIKQVVGSQPEFLAALSRKNVLQAAGCQATFAFSPEYGSVTPDELHLWMQEWRAHTADAVLNVQLHKVLNLSEAK